MCRLKWVVAALRGLWPRGTFWLMELMLTLVGLLDFPLVFSSFGILSFFKTSSDIFLTFAVTSLFFLKKILLPPTSLLRWPWLFPVSCVQQRSLILPP